ncbi:MAG TPA: flagellar assembly protein FliW [Firmicutes bacterium]|nr:flagellar assembly protein FliW [Bacillota bacterium]
MKYPTKRFGIVDVTTDQVLTFPEGLIGFQSCRKFIVMNLDKTGILKWLQSLDDESLGFAILDPRMAFKDYDPVFTPKDLEPLSASDPGELILLSVVTVPRDIKKMTANLQAPLVINPKKRLGKQVISIVPEYTTRHMVFLPLQNLMKRTG